MENREFANEFHDYDEVTSSDEARSANSSVITAAPAEDGQVTRSII